MQLISFANIGFKMIGHNVVQSCQITKRLYSIFAFLLTRKKLFAIYKSALQKKKFHDKINK